MRVVKSIHELIGSTPILEITQFSLPKMSEFLLNWNFLIQVEV